MSVDVLSDVTVSVTCPACGRKIEVVCDGRVTGDTADRLLRMLTGLHLLKEHRSYTNPEPRSPLPQRMAVGIGLGLVLVAIVALVLRLEQVGIEAATIIAVVLGLTSVAFGLTGAASSRGRGGQREPDGSTESKRSSSDSERGSLLETTRSRAECPGCGDAWWVPPDRLDGTWFCGRCAEVEDG